MGKPSQRALLKTGRFLALAEVRTSLCAHFGGSKHRYKHAEEACQRSELMFGLAGERFAAVLRGRLNHERERWVP